MDKIKPVYRRAITLRYVKWTTLRLLSRVLPVIRNGLSFYPDAASILDFNNVEVVQNGVIEDRVEFNQCEKDYIDKHCGLDEEYMVNDSSGEAGIEVLIAKIKKCHVLGHTGTIVDPVSGLIVLPEKRAQKSWILNWNQAKAAWLSEQSLPGCSLSMLGFHKGHKQYYHFFVNDFLPLCYYLLNFYDKSVPINILVRCELAEFQRNAYQFLGKVFPKIKIVQVKENQKIITDELVVIGYLGKNRFRTFSNDKTITFLRSLFLNGYGTGEPASQNRFLYIGRGDVRIRKPVNENDVIALLARYGFKSIEPGRLSHAEQVRLFNSAKLIVGIHGAGLTNVMFCQSDAHLLEISPENYVQSTYMWMAKKVGMRFSHLLGSKGDYHQNFQVDLIALERKVRELIAITNVTQEPA